MRDVVDCFEEIHYGLMYKLNAGTLANAQYGDVSLCLAQRQLSGQSEHRQLSPMEFQIMWLLTRAQGGYVSRDEIMYFLYEHQERDLPLYNTVEVMVGRLRRKLNAVSEEVKIWTFRSFGYQLVS